MMNIVVFGTTFVDIKGCPDCPYIPAGRNAGTIHEVHGGVGRNIAEDIANIGLPVTFVSTADHSALSQGVLERLARSGVDASHIRRTADGLGTWLAVFNEQGDVVASISKRPDLSAIAETCAAEGDRIMADCSEVLVEIDMEPEVLAPVFDLAEKYACRVCAVTSNITIAAERMDYLRKCWLFVLNRQEAGIFFGENYDALSPGELMRLLPSRLAAASLPRMIVTLGDQGAVFASAGGKTGFVPALTVPVVDTTGAGDAFFAGVSAALACGKKMAEACEIGTRLAASVIQTTENVCPRINPEELGLDPEIV